MAIYRESLSNDSRYSITLTIDETDSGQTRTLTYSLTATKTSGIGYYSYDNYSPCGVSIDNVSLFNQNISYDFQGSTPKTITLASGTLTSTQHTFSGQTIPVYAYFSSYPNDLGDATINSTFTLNNLHKNPTNASYTITELNQDLIDAGIDDDVFVRDLSKKQFVFTATLYDGATILLTRVLNGESVMNGVNSTPENPDTCIFDFSLKPMYPLTYITPPQPTKTGIVTQLYDNQGGSVNVNNANIYNPDIYDYVPYNKVQLNDNSIIFKRRGQISGNAYISLNGTFYIGEVGNVDQTNGYKPIIKYKFWKSEDDEPLTYPYTINSNDITIDVDNSSYNIYQLNIGSIIETDPNYFDPNFAWKIKFEVSDNFTTVESTKEIKILKSQYLWGEYPDRVDFKKITRQNEEVFSNVYKTTELVIGQYKNKPLYRKVIDATLDLRSAGLHLYDGGLSNVDELVSMEYHLNTDAYKLIYNSAISACGINNTTNDIYLYTNIAWDNNLAFTFVAEYTKTTD